MRTRMILLILGASVPLALPAAASARSDDPVAHASKLPSSVTGTVPAGGTATFTSPPLDSGVMTLHVDVIPADLIDIGGIQAFFAKEKSRKNKVLTCISFHQVLTSPYDDVTGKTVEVDDDTRLYAQLILNACMEMALTAPAQTRQAGIAAASCKPDRVEAPMKVTRGGAGYRIKIAGTLTKAKSRSKVVITCKRKGKGLTFTARARKKGASLRSVVGKTLGLGFHSPADAGSRRIKVTYRK